MLVKYVNHIDRIKKAVSVMWQRVPLFDSQKFEKYLLTPEFS